METPRMSDGSRSEVNWIRWKLTPRDLARAWASVVLPTPGTSSIRRCPLASRAACGPPPAAPVSTGPLRSCKWKTNTGQRARLPLFMGKITTSYPAEGENVGWLRGSKCAFGTLRRRVVLPNGQARAAGEPAQAVSERGLGGFLSALGLGQGEGPSRPPPSRGENPAPGPRVL